MSSLPTQPLQPCVPNSPTLSPADAALLQFTLDGSFDISAVCEKAGIKPSSFFAWIAQPHIHEAIDRHIEFAERQANARVQEALARALPDAIAGLARHAAAPLAACPPVPKATGSQPILDTASRADLKALADRFFDDDAQDEAMDRWLDSDEDDWDNDDEDDFEEDEDDFPDPRADAILGALESRYHATHSHSLPTHSAPLNPSGSSLPEAAQRPNQNAGAKAAAAVAPGISSPTSPTAQRSYLSLQPTHSLPTHSLQTAAPQSTVPVIRRSLPATDVPSPTLALALSAGSLPAADSLPTDRTPAPGPLDTDSPSVLSVCSVVNSESAGSLPTGALELAPNNAPVANPPQHSLPTEHFDRTATRDTKSEIEITSNHSLPTDHTPAPGSLNTDSPPVLPVCSVVNSESDDSLPTDSPPEISFVAAQSTLWFTQAQLASIFNLTRQDIAHHVREILASAELTTAAIRTTLMTASDGKCYQTRLHSLDLALAIARRLRWPSAARGATAFRTWLATSRPDLASAA